MGRKSMETIKIWWYFIAEYDEADTRKKEKGKNMATLLLVIIYVCYIGFFAHLYILFAVGFVLIFVLRLIGYSLDRFEEYKRGY